MFIDVIFGFIWNWSRNNFNKFKCNRGWHKWNMYAGYDEVRIHPQAHCLRKNCKVTGKQYLEARK